MAAVLRPDRYELVNGVEVAVSDKGAYADEVKNRLHAALTRFLFAVDVGRSRIGIAYVLPLPEDATRTRRPDVAYVSYRRWAEDRRLSLVALGIEVIPELVAEVVGPADADERLTARACEYLRAGVPRVWHIDPKDRELREWVGNTVRVYQDSSDITLPDLLPGFRLRLTDILPAMADRSS